ncbi:hypothetical protein JXR93_09225 [bacterium]|nr:hypothetical protein [bacterium]
MKKVILMLFMLSLFSCSTDTQTKKTGLDLGLTFIKAKEGSVWRYTGELLGEKKNIELSISEKDATSYTDSKGQKYIVDSYGIRGENLYYIKYPLQKGVTWVNRTTQGVEIATIEDVDISFKFGPDTIENCVKVSYQSQPDGENTTILTRTFCPDLWMVEFETFVENEKEIAIPQSKFSLESFVY